MPACIFSARARAFPASERLEAWPGSGRCALRTVDIRDACLDLIEEPFGLLRTAVEPPRPAVEPRRQAVVHIVGVLHGLFEAAYFRNGGDGQEHLVLP